MQSTSMLTICSPNTACFESKKALFYKVVFKIKGLSTVFLIFRMNECYIRAGDMPKVADSLLCLVFIRSRVEFLILQNATTKNNNVK